MPLVPLMLLSLPGIQLFSIVVTRGDNSCRHVMFGLYQYKSILLYSLARTPKHDLNNNYVKITKFEHDPIRHV